MNEEPAVNAFGRASHRHPAGDREARVEGSPQAIFTTGNRELLCMLGHDLRAPLNWLLGFLDLLAETELNADQHACLSTARLCGKDLLETLSGILDGVRADTGHLQLNERWNDLREVLSRAVEVFRAQAALHEIRFDWNVNATVPRWWYFDGPKVRQILANLLANALKFTPAGSVRLEVDILPAEAEAAPRLRMIVRDTGIGIPEEDLAHLFEPFRRGSSSAGESHPGNGLGLAIVQRLTVVLHGSVDVRCPNGGGTDVTLLFSWPSSREVAPAATMP